MGTRRQVSLSLLSMMATFAVPNIARATRILEQTCLGTKLGDDKASLAGSEFLDLNSCVIKVIGVGRGGCEMVRDMIADKSHRVDFICADTDAQVLSSSAAKRRVLLGKNGLGTENNPSKGRKAAQAVEADIRDAIQGAHILFITAGMGGGTGCGAAPVIASTAREMGIHLTVGLATTPLEFEGVLRQNHANLGLSELESHVDSLIVMPNDKHFHLSHCIGMEHMFFSLTNEVLRNAVDGIAEVVNVAGHAAIDLEDVRFVMSGPGRARLGTAVAEGPDRSRIAAERAMTCPLMRYIDLSVANGCVVLISASKDSLRLSESKRVLNIIRANVSANAHVSYGTFEDDRLGNQIRVTLIAKGMTPSFYAWA